MNTAISEKLAELLADSEKIVNESGYTFWTRRVIEFLRAAIGSGAAASFDVLSAPTWPEQRAKQRGHLEGLIARAEAEAAKSASGETEAPQVSQAQRDIPPVLDSRKVFVVHGHDNEAKEGVARFLERLGLVPIILHEQASAGRTIIEKFETYADDVAFAVVLLTPDDVGAAVPRASDLKKRARQNVIMELGYFIGRLGRTRVCALHKGGVELPSDYQGVLYVEMDAAAAWRAKLAQELVQAKIQIDLTALLGG